MQAVNWNEKPPWKGALANLERSDCPLLWSVLRKPKTISRVETGGGHPIKRGTRKLKFLSGSI